MLSLDTIEAPQPLLASGQFSESEAKPYWAMKKLSLARCTQATKYGRKVPGQTDSKDFPGLFEEPAISEKIPIKYFRRTDDRRYSSKVVYEGYKSQNLRSMQDYLNFVLGMRKILPNRVHDCSSDKKDYSQDSDLLNSPELSAEIKNYYNSVIETKLPEKISQEKVLIFDSNFESANLDRACIVSLNEYNLFLNADTNTKGHSQWFYFAVTNTEKGRTVTFNIVNCTKWVPLFRFGMKPLVFSEIDFETSGTGWVPETRNVSYTRNMPIKATLTPVAQFDTPQSQQAGPSYYTLTFSYTFEHTDDRVYFAYTYPYTTTMLRELLSGLKESLLVRAKGATVLEPDGLQRRIKEFVQEGAKRTEEELRRKKPTPEDQFKVQSCKRGKTLLGNFPVPETSLIASEVLKEYASQGKSAHFSWLQSQDYQIETESFIYLKETLCHTLSGFPVELITITGYNTPRHPLERRKVIFITARVHAAEVAGSFKMEGILRYLTSNNKRAEILRSLYVFKIVPMLNPEGVLCGNFRCTLTGTDLNRRWDCPDETLHPQIYYLKNLLKKLTAEGKRILVFCDLHGHGRKLNSFIYGCNKVANGSFCSWTKVRLLPRILARKSPLFNYNDCKFVVETDKQRTARVVIWKELGVTNSFTLESSCFGYVRGDEVCPFKPEDYYSIGESFLDSLLEYHHVLKSVEKELIITKGWLKPSKLVELTGTPAAIVLAKKIAQEKVASKKKLRLSRIKKLLTTKRYNKYITKRKQMSFVRSQMQGRGDVEKVPGTDRRGEIFVPREVVKFNANIKAKIDQKEDSSKTIVREKSELVEEVKESAYENYEDDEDSIVQEPEKLPTLRNAEKSQKITNKSMLEPSMNLPIIYTKTVDTKETGSVSKDPNNSERMLETNSDSSESSDGEEDKQTQDHYQANSWQKYFSLKEIENAYNNIVQGIDIQDEEANESAGSESNPSEDDAEKDEIQELIHNIPCEEQQQETRRAPHPSTRMVLQRHCKDSRKDRDEGNRLHKIDLQWEPSFPHVTKSELKTTTLATEPRNSAHMSVSRRTQKTCLRQSDYMTLAPFAEGRPYETRREFPAGRFAHRSKLVISRATYNHRQASGNIVARPAQEYKRSACCSKPHVVEYNSNNINNGKDYGEPNSDIGFTIGDTNSNEEKHTPTININIKNINIQQPPSPSSSYPQRYQRGVYRATQLARASEGSSVIASMPRHDESKKFKKLFRVPNKLYSDYTREKSYIRRERRMDDEGAAASLHDSQPGPSLRSSHVFHASYLYSQPQQQAARFFDD